MNLHHLIRVLAPDFLDSAESIKSTSTPIFDSIDMTADPDAPKKEKILSMLGSKDSLNSPQLANMLGTGVDDVKRLLLDLQAMKLVENVVGDYYHLTYEGYRYLKQALSKRLF